MKYGPVLTYKDVKKAEKLIGKKVFYSDTLSAIELDVEKNCEFGILEYISKEGSFLIKGLHYWSQFIREVIE